MKKIWLLLLSFVFILLSNAQGKTSNASWSFSVNKISDCEAELVFTVKVDEGWHVYSQLYDANPTTFTFNKAGNYKRIGKVTEPTPYKEVDIDLGMTLFYFKPTTVSFKQKIELNSNQPFKISGNLVAQICTDQGICEISQKDFSFSVDPAGATCLKDPDDTDGDGMGNNEDKCPDIPGIKELMGCPDGDNDGVADVEDTCPEDPGTKENKGCPIENGGGGIVDSGEPTNTNYQHVEPQKLTQENLSKLNPECGSITSAKKTESFWWIFLKGFLGGFAALIMPCLFPMIPMTVSFFTKQSKTRAKGIANAFIYAISIIVIYTSLGLLVTIIAGPTALNNMSTSTFWNILFFAVFIIFAASFLGAFEIVLPSKLVNAVDKGSNKGGLIGIFFMAFTLSLVSFSCTGPIIGTLLIDVSKGTSYLGPAIGMFGFSLALALPFALFAAFPGWMNTLPKSGGWLNSVKVVLGFVEIALAFKFLSTVDLVQHWGFLKREIYIAIWIACATLTGLYLIGAFNLKHDSDGKPKLSVPRVSFAVLFFVFAIYMVPGLFGAPLSLLSGYLPPSYYKEWKDPNDKFADCPNGMECYHDYDEGMAKAKQRNKPVMLDFTGYGCVNCRKMEDKVWIDPKVYKILSEQLVLISLYVDDYDRKLPIKERVKALSSNKTLKSYGDKWGDFQQYYFGTTQQPQYILLTPDGQLLTGEQAYTKVETYYSWLEEGMCRWDAIKAGTKGDS